MAGLAALAGLALALAAVLHPSGGAVVGRPAPGGPRPAAQRPAAQQPAAAERVGPETQIRFTRVFGGCDRTESGTGPAPPGLYGMDRDQLAAALPGTRVVRFDSRIVELRIDVAGCPSSAFTAVLRDGLVIVYRGAPPHLGPVDRVTTLRAADLAPADRDRLALGIVLPDAAAVDRLVRSFGRPAGPEGAVGRSGPATTAGVARGARPG